MTGIQVLAARPRRTIGALALALAAAGVAVGSGADFTSRSANPSNTFTAGTLTADNSRDGAALFSPANMKPGGAPQTGTVDIANTGSLPAAFTLTRDRLESTDTGESNPAPFAAKVNLVVTDCGAFGGGGAPACGDSGDHVVYDGTLAAMEAAAGLGDFGAGEKHRYVFAAGLDSSAGNEYQGDGSSARFVWDAAQK
jgi:spore coat-associated protein N